MCRKILKNPYKNSTRPNKLGKVAGYKTNKTNVQNSIYFYILEMNNPKLFIDIVDGQSYCFQFSGCYK